MYDYIVVGSGVHGISSAYYLANQGHHVVLIEQFQIGHNQGSSHAPTRIIRTAYDKNVYRDMAALALRKYWPEMEKILMSQLIAPNPCIYFDDTSHYNQIADVAKTDPNKSLVFMNCKDLKLKYPLSPNIQTSTQPIVDLSAGVVFAEIYQKKLKQKLLKMKNVKILELTTIVKIEQNNQFVSVITNKGVVIKGIKAVVTCGKFVGELIPRIRKLVAPIKQLVGYIQVQQEQKHIPGQYLSFIHRNNEGEEYYSLPGIQGEGVKLAKHENNLNLERQQNEELRKQKLQNKFELYFGKRFKKVKKYDYCYYTVTKTEDFIIDWVSSDERILVCSACSGHGFKFGPLIGKIVTDLLLHNRTIQVFQKDRHFFQFPYHEGINLS